jgi:hypothetical protein
VLDEPLICDYVLKNTEGTVTQEVRFDLVPGSSPTITVETLAPLTEDFPITATEWKSSVAVVSEFMERAFKIDSEKWPRDIEPDMEIRYSGGGTRLMFEALTAPAQTFERTVDYSVVGGSHGIILRPFMVSDPVLLRTWILFYKAVETLLEMNNGGSTTEGL